MRRFVIKVLLFPIGLILSYAFFYFCFYKYSNVLFEDKDAIFVWGDSQSYRGLDLKKISGITGKRVYSSANSAAGVYDFLLFTEQVCENTQVIVSISKLVQVRRKKNDNNRSGISLWALKKMHENNYSIQEVLSIIKLNLKPRNNISKSTKMFTYSDSVEAELTLPLFKDYYQEIPSFLEDKQNLYFLGIKNLIRKNCKISFIEFPYHHYLEDVENQSPIKERTENFKYELSRLFSTFKMDTIKINRDRNIFKDLSHLNCLGAEDLSKKLGKKIRNDELTTLYIAR